MGGPSLAEAAHIAVFGEVSSFFTNASTTESTMPETPSIRLEQGTALSLLWETVDDLRQTATDLHAAVDAHAMATFQFLRDFADGCTSDPSALLRSRGQVEALLAQLGERAEHESSHLDELRVTLTSPDLDDPLEAQALATFQERYRRRAGTAQPKDPRPGEHDG